MSEEIQKLELVDRLFPVLFSGKKRDTVRWKEGEIGAGFLMYYATNNPDRKAIVWVTDSKHVPLNTLASHYNQTPEELWKSMQSHYPDIQIDDEVLFIQHLSPKETLAKCGPPEML